MSLDCAEHDNNAEACRSNMPFDDKRDQSARVRVTSAAMDEADGPRERLG